MQVAASAVASGLELEVAFAVVGLGLQASAVRLPGLVQGLARVAALQAVARVAALQAVATAAVREPGVLAATVRELVAGEVQTVVGEQQKQAGLRRLEQPPEQQGNPQHQQEQLAH